VRRPERSRHKSTERSSGVLRTLIASIKGLQEVSVDLEEAFGIEVSGVDWVLDTDDPVPVIFLKGYRHSGLLSEG